ncbi:alpha/beta hydrolase [Vagococcus sp. PNs007]|uniref:Alpha/beta hydrolase n=1 Tax=Vagococcus proximus TaxID=2991417 RepID=A0ABT5WZ94_9ENTE|nr:alpha/beta hydrolase [Vagococcus proximus]
MLLLLVLVFSGISYLSVINKQQQVFHPAPNVLNDTSPVIFIHGSGGNETNMIPFAQQLNKKMTSDDILKIKVKKDGTLEYLSDFGREPQYPCVFIGYEEPEASIQNWAVGLATVIDSLDKTYHFKSYKLVGFSNGGLAGSYYIESPLSKKHKKDITHLALLGSPFNDLDPITNETLDDLTTKSDSYFKQFSDATDGIPHTLKVLSIAGDNQQGTLSDGTVPISSAFGSRIIFKPTVSLYQEKTIKASHGELISPENTSLVTEVATFLTK